jgi:hypothetical protein
MEVLHPQPPLWFVRVLVDAECVASNQRPCSLIPKFGIRRLETALQTELVFFLKCFKLCFDLSIVQHQW